MISTFLQVLIFTLVWALVFVQKQKDDISPFSNILRILFSSFVKHSLLFLKDKSVKFKDTKLTFHFQRNYRIWSFISSTNNNYENERQIKLESNWKRWYYGENPTLPSTE